MSDPYAADPLWGYDSSPDSDPWGPSPASGARGDDRYGDPRSANGSNGSNGSPRANGGGDAWPDLGRAVTRDGGGDVEGPGSGRTVRSGARDVEGPGSGRTVRSGAPGDEIPHRGRSTDALGPPPPDRIAPPPPSRPSAPQVFIPAPEDLPPFDEVVEPIYPRREPVVVPDPGPAPDAFDDGGVPAPPVLAPGDEPPPAPDLSRPRVAGAAGAATPSQRKPIDRRRIAVVYDVEGPRVRLGLAWFVGAIAATVLAPFTIAVVLAVAAGFAGRQVVRAWGSVQWQADLAAGLGAVPVLAALLGTRAIVAAAVVAVLVAVGASFAPDGPRLPGRGGRRAAAGILVLAVVPALGAACVVLVRAESVIAAAVLIVLASAYEVGDYIVGSGASNPIEGPLAGVTTATLVSLPLAIILVEPYNDAGLALIAFTALACPLGQVVASAVLPGAGAHAPALRRIDTLLVLAPLWAAAAGAF